MTGWTVLDGFDPGTCLEQRPIFNLMNPRMAVAVAVDGELTAAVGSCTSLQAKKKKKKHF